IRSMVQTEPVSSNWKQKWRGKTSPLFIFQVFLVIVCLVVVFSLSDRSGKSHWAENRDVKLAVSANLLPHLILGFTMVAADAIWLRLIQDMDYKEPDKQSKGWVYQLLNDITTLDHRYRMAYSLGLTVLSVAVDDTEGARLLYDRAMEYFPDDWVILYKTG